jgi:heat shock protein HslJ
MRTWRGLGFVTLGLALLGCSSSQSPAQRELTIAPAPVACAGTPPETCLRATEPEGDQWLMRFDEIDGFAYEPGFTWQVLVEEPPLNEELAVVPRLRLVRVLSKEPAAGAAEPGPLGRGEWRLQSITPASAGAQAQAWSVSGITAAFDVGGGWVAGFAGCDRYLGALTVNGDKVTISAPATTHQLCASDMASRQRTYLLELAKALSYSVSGENLELKLLDGGKMGFRAADG